MKDTRALVLFFHGFCRFNTMRKNKFIIPLIISIFICTLYSCEEQEIQPFSGETAVNFVGKVGNEWYIYEENIRIVCEAHRRWLIQCWKVQTLVCH